MDHPDGQRIDKWLWHARLLKTRTLAASLVSKGKVRLNSAKISKPAQTVRPGDILTFFHGGRVRTVEILQLATRRGPASEAAGLYADLNCRAAGGSTHSTQGE